MPDIRIDNVRNSFVDVKQGNRLNQSQGVAFLRKLPVLQFVDDGFTGHQIKIGSMFVPPLARPCAARQHRRFRAHLVVEAWYRGLDVNATIHAALRLKFDDPGWASNLL